MTEKIDITKELENVKPLIDSIIEKYIPKKIDEKDLVEILGKTKFKNSPKAINESLIEPFWDFMGRGGKRWRPALFLLITEALGGNLEKNKDFAIIPELIHNATIIHDDIEDRSELRRGKPCLHKIYGEDVAINVGDLLYFIPSLVFQKNKKDFTTETLNMAYEVYLQELLRIGIGQTTDINWHNKQEIDVGEPEYLQMCYNKTGCMPRLAGRLAAILSGADEKTTETIGNLCGTIGVAFQIQDDCLSASGGKFAEGKGYGDDITEGKRSLPVIYTLKAANEKDRRRLIEILNMHTTDRKLIDEALAILKRYGSVEKAKKKTRELVGEAWAELDKVLKPSEAKEKIKAFAYYLIERDI